MGRKLWDFVFVFFLSYSLIEQHVLAATTYVAGIYPGHWEHNDKGVIPGLTVLAF